MSDEEKKAIESFKEENNNDLSRFDDFNSYTQFKVKRDKLIIDLVEKQQKEIEELKEDNKHQWEERCKLTFELENSTSNDKIKAKIEPKLKELDEQINEEWKKYGNSKELQDMEDMYNFLQSLLEKE